ncbi:MAG: DNA repair protein rad16 [Geoglossum umbratile]|nr:MAG: DNA repair protein rad16 [Geoglossum umbratile]
MSDYPAKSPSLVLVPPVALMEWQSEINDYTNGKLRVLVYHGQEKSKLSRADLRKHNVILVTYAGLEYIYRKQQKGVRRKEEDVEEVELVKADSLIHSLKWHRVILDEAHSIKTRMSNTSKAYFALKANHKWCLSGTPFQNRIGELFSLLMFLEIKPFAYYLCKSCPCKELHWNFVDKRCCATCGHWPMEHVSIFNKEILDPTGNAGEGQIAFGNLQLLLDRVMLRRLKKDHVSTTELPPKQVIIHCEAFNEIELDLATSVMTNSTRQFDNYVAQGVVLNNSANIFGLIMQMRQIANHPDPLFSPCCGKTTNKVLHSERIRQKVESTRTNPL